MITVMIIAAITLICTMVTIIIMVMIMVKLNIENRIPLGAVRAFSVQNGFSGVLQKNSGSATN